MSRRKSQIGSRARITHRGLNKSEHGNIFIKTEADGLITRKQCKINRQAERKLINWYKLESEEYLRKTLRPGSKTNGRDFSHGERLTNDKATGLFLSWIAQEFLVRPSLETYII